MLKCMCVFFLQFAFKTGGDFKILAHNPSEMCFARNNSFFLDWNHMMWDKVIAMVVGHCHIENSGILFRSEILYVIFWFLIFFD